MLGQSPLARGVPATPLLTDVMNKLRRASRALVDVLAKGRDDADNLFENIENSVEETRSAMHEIEDASREIHGSLRELCDKGLRSRSRNSK